MTLYMDIHSKAQGVTIEAVADAHALDMATQEKYGVRYLTYWFNEGAGKIFCLCEAPSREAADAVHREAHGLVADQLIEVQQQMVDALLGPAPENDGAQLDPESNTKLDTAFRTVLYTDMEDSTAITQRIGDAGMVALLRAHDAVIRRCLEEHGGRVVKHTGDGFLVSYTSVARAVECAIGMQRSLEAYGRAHPDLAVRIRIGISAGEPVEDSDDLFGATVQLASRACAQAEAGQIVVSNVVRELCIGKVIAFGDLGVRMLKGFAEPVQLHEVRWTDAPTSRRSIGAL
jgi:class 3 adenylate cyclase